MTTLDFSKPVTTRDGRKVTIYCTDAFGQMPIHGHIHGKNGPDAWYEGGSFYRGEQSDSDLIQARRTLRLRCWVNVYINLPKNQLFGGGVQPSTEDADDAADKSRFARILIDRDVIEGARE